MTEQCKAEPLGGGRCELEAQHPGPHRKTSYPYGPGGRPFVHEWTDEGQRRLIAEHGSRFD